MLPIGGYTSSSSADGIDDLSGIRSRKRMSVIRSRGRPLDEAEYNADVESVGTPGSTRRAVVPKENKCNSVAVHDVPSASKKDPLRSHVIPAELSKGRERLDQKSRSKVLSSRINLPESPPQRIGSNTSSDEDLPEKEPPSWTRMKRKFRRLLRLSSTTNTRNDEATPPSCAFLPDALPKPPLLPRQNSNPLGLLPAPPRPKALKPLKSSPSPLLHRATPFSDKNYDSVSCKCSSTPGD